MLLVLYAGNLSGQALESLKNGKSSFEMALEQVRKISGINKIVILEGNLPLPMVDKDIQTIKKDFWSVNDLLETLISLSAGFDHICFAWADCPFLDPGLAEKLIERHIRYAAEYSYADGWPYGLAVELLLPSAAVYLKKLADKDNDKNEKAPVTRDMLFSVIQKDINAFDIETEISSIDLRCHRLNLCADSKRNHLLLRRFLDANKGEIPDTSAVEKIIAEKPDILRTLPAFYPIQVFEGCPQSCKFCPWPIIEKNVTEKRGFMEAAIFESILDKIIDFSGDAVIDLSLWGELALHPKKLELIEMVLRRSGLSLVIETSGIGWKDSELEACSQMAEKYKANSTNSLCEKFSWIVSLDSADPKRYMEIRGAGFAEANACAKKLFSLFPNDTYVQAVRTAGDEDDIEKFFRSWKEALGDVKNIIVQKYDDFCGLLPKKQASDLSPVERKPCWHLMRDMPVLLDGTVPLCRQSGEIILGNVLTEPLDLIWERGQKNYLQQAGLFPGIEKYNSLCAGCDEYYTFNF